jgi:hypothetical protein
VALKNGRRKPHLVGTTSRSIISTEREFCWPDGAPNGASAKFKNFCVLEREAAAHSTGTVTGTPFCLSMHYIVRLCGSASPA